ncbi:TetR/AcrR family transcriptional regulator [Thermoactinospora rubra]|uniref:TetR/AcrR family transcriptional regulator n=1 Tax=Thermoactinospora rubra TaxID=1088767 RepID=UPI000A0F5F33|nr:TetR/AcrR family transcriptional regulator [Thermoactinospora rubra]
MTTRTAGKRRAILTGALTVFARDGYTRASIDAIAAEAGVSTRTIYKHFTDKAGLFQAVIRDSGARAAETQLAAIDRFLRKVTDLEADLTDFGVAMAAPSPGDEAHFALVRQINAEAGHIPPEAIEAWQEAGPRRVKRELARRLGELLPLSDPELAARHLMALIATAAPSPHDPPPSSSRTAELVAAAVRVFLYGYRGER